ncbi:MAG: HD domain-containing protein [Bacteroidota bacterium]
MHQSLFRDTEQFVKNELNAADSGHDWHHAYRVWKMARLLAKDTNADTTIIEIAALIHDVADVKINNNPLAGISRCKIFLNSLEITSEQQVKILEIIQNLSFRKEAPPALKKNLEFMLVQDADRLDALGAIGIARVFSYGQKSGQPLHDPDLVPRLGMSKEEYKQNKSTSLNHFHEKLFLLKDLMNTSKARNIAKEREEFMKRFIEQFLSEWNQLDF